MITEFDCYRDLPFCGNLPLYDAQRGFGLIDGKLFCHAKQRKGDPTPLKDSGSIVLFAAGTMPSRPERQAVRWCLVENVDWGSRNAPTSQQDYLARRKDWLAGLDARRLAKLLRADWYCNDIWKKVAGGAPPDLEDPALEHRIVDFLKQNDGHLISRIIRAMEESPHDFCLRWMQGHDHKVAQELLATFPLSTLAQIRLPDVAWLQQIPSQQGMIAEWALRCRTGNTHWMAALARANPWEQQLAWQLLRSNDWFPDADGWILPWFERLAQAGQIRSAEFLERINRHPQENSIWLRFLDTLDRVAAISLALDLETDGEIIWQAGIADVLGPRLLFDAKNQHGNLNEAAKEELARSVTQTSLLIGHNLLAWDMPVLVGAGVLKKYPACWDTLLVSFLLEPWKHSHALNGSHQADDDARCAFNLFLEQIKHFPDDLIDGFLKNLPATDSELAVKLADAASAMPIERPEPDWLSPYKSGTQRLIVLPPQYVAELAWVPCVRVVSGAGIHPDTQEMALRRLPTVKKDD